jgi:hypothetical protein
LLFNNANSPETAPYSGHQGLFSWARGVQDAIGEFRVEAIDVDGTASLSSAGVRRGPGERPARRGLAETTVFTLRNGKIVTVQAYDMKAEALEAVGLRE